MSKFLPESFSNIYQRIQFDVRFFEELLAKMQLANKFCYNVSS